MAENGAAEVPGPAPTPFSINVEALVPGITADVMATLRQRAIEGFGYSVQRAVGEQIDAYIKTEVLPAVAEELKAHRAEIIAAMVGGVVAASMAAGEAIKDAVTKKMTGFEGEKVVAQLLSAMSPKAY